jgi:4'-phosphopantetheinyl transferase
VSLQLASAEAHCWCVPLDVPRNLLASLSATLTHDERQRAARLRSERDRRGYVVARAALRELLGDYLGAPPAELRFEYNEFGKPELGPEFGSSIEFNLSHSADLALIAVATDAVGVDLEFVREGNYDDIARYFGLEPRAFFRDWTKLEAYMKARGAGLADGPVEFPGDWSFFLLRPAPGYIGTVAVEGISTSLIFRTRPFGRGTSPYTM